MSVCSPADDHKVGEVEPDEVKLLLLQKLMVFRMISPNDKTRLADQAMTIYATYSKIPCLVDAWATLPDPDANFNRYIEKEESSVFCGFSCSNKKKSAKKSPRNKTGKETEEVKETRSQTQLRRRIEKAASAISTLNRRAAVLALQQGGEPSTSNEDTHEASLMGILLSEDDDAGSLSLSPEDENTILDADGIDIDPFLFISLEENLFSTLSQVYNEEYRGRWLIT